MDREAADISAQVDADRAARVSVWAALGTAELRAQLHIGNSQLSHGDTVQPIAVPVCPSRKHLTRAHSQQDPFERPFSTVLASVGEEMMPSDRLSPACKEYKQQWCCLEGHAVKNE